MIIGEKTNAITMASARAQCNYKQNVVTNVLTDG
jgi:hypothetical protein